MAGKLLVRVPFYSMVNLIAGRAVVPELMQGQMNGESLAREAQSAARRPGARREMKAGLAAVKEKLALRECRRRAARRPSFEEILEGQIAHAS
jgi:lipid-A-disaccharide synthase